MVDKICWRSRIDLADDDRIRFRGKPIGIVLQAFNLLPRLTVAENVAVPLSINGEPRAGAIARARGVLARVGLAERARRPASPR